MMFQSIFHAGTFSVENVVITMLVALLCGLMVALVFRLHNMPSGKYAIILSVLPLITSCVILVVNGNLGTSVAMLGAFGLVRFRSAPGSAAEIGYIFYAMTVGLAAGMGFLVMALVMTAVIGGVILIAEFCGMGDALMRERMLRITIPESLNYTGLFDDVMDIYTTYNCLTRVRTTGMGTMYELSYRLKFKRGMNEKAFIDELRCRNGNLDIMLGIVQGERGEM
ncbi:MAG: DUF4956 domain-containing protein [Lachnospiraceae bacterium]|nr:DUF4956 domain-containing protein [Lachnospiraceae bacterium]